MRRYAMSAVVVIALAACVHPTDSGGPPIPAGSLVYTIVPTALQYSLVDSTDLALYRLDWLTPIFSGYNCLGLLAASPTDTTGSFVFSWSGTNTGLLERLSLGTTDTTLGYFFPPIALGTRGTYVVESNQRLTLTWADGFQSRYFQPAAVIRLVGGTIISDVDLLTRGDSVREVWHVEWALSGDTGC